MFEYSPLEDWRLHVRNIVFVAVGFESHFHKFISLFLPFLFANNMTRYKTQLFAEIILCKKPRANG